MMNTITTSDTVDGTKCCEKCAGTGYQQRNDGVYVICPICKGSGRQSDILIPCVPWYPVNPWCPGQDSWQDKTYQRDIVVC